MNKLRVVQVGTGTWVHSAHIAEALKGLTDIYEVIGIVEEDEARIPDMMTRPAYAGYEFITWEGALAAKPDAFIIETDEHKLVENAIRALEYGYPVYMDKPGSEDAGQFRRMCELAASKNLPLELGYMYRENAAIRYAHELVKNGTFGHIFSVEGQMGVGDSKSYREMLKRFKGGMLYYLGCHLIDLVVTFCGVPKEIIPLNVSTGLDNVGSIDLGMAAFRYDNGVSYVRTCASEPGAALRRSVIISGYDATLHISRMEVPRPGVNTNIPEAKITIGRQDPWRDRSQKLDFAPERRYDRLLKNFASYVRGEAVNPYTPEYEAELHDIIMTACGYDVRRQSREDKRNGKIPTCH